MTRALLLIAGTDTGHDLLASGPALQQILCEGGIAAQHGMGLGRFASPWAPVRLADVFVVYCMGHAATPEDEAALSELVAAGKGLVVLHASNVLTREMLSQDRHRAWFDLIGSRFTGHAEFCSFEVEVLPGAHPVTRGLQRFRVDDEPYTFAWTNGPCEVLAERLSDGGRAPCVYVKPHGQGRVCYIALGHDQRTWGHPAFRRLLIQATFWCGQTPEAEVAVYRNSLWPPDDPPPEESASTGARR